MTLFPKLFVICSLLCSAFHQTRSVTIDEAFKAAESKNFNEGGTQDDNSILVEYDMRFTPEQWAGIKNMRSGKRRHKRNALKSTKYRWTNGVVPYTIQSSGFSHQETSRIKNGINEWNKFTCVNIRPKINSDKYWVHIIPTGGCSSMVGMTRRRGQRMTLGPGCRFRGIVAHEFGHALGFHHEQTRPDRDRYVRILNQNIKPSAKFNFKKYDWNKIDSYNVPYDYMSVMHYGQYAFSANGKRTIETLDPKYQKVIGNRYGVSFYDVKLVTLMYNCNQNCPKKSCPGDGFVAKDCKCWCKGPTREQPIIYCDSKTKVGGGLKIGATPKTNQKASSGGPPKRSPTNQRPTKRNPTNPQPTKRSPTNQRSKKRRAKYRRPNNRRPMNRQRRRPVYRRRYQRRRPNPYSGR